MAELETITILRVDTGQAVNSVQDLKDNIKLLKDAVNQAEIGSQEYTDALNELKVNQNALRDAMYATSASMEDVAKAATGAGDSYNALVHRMAALKEEFRSTGDAARRMELGAQIRAVNDELKKMDALQGNFQRNVGNYAGSIKEALGQLPSFMSPVKSGLDNIHPWSRPKANEVTSEIRVFAAQGEQEMMRFGILPLNLFFHRLLFLLQFLFRFCGMVFFFTHVLDLFSSLYNSKKAANGSPD